MAKFHTIEWLISFLESQDCFIFDWDNGNSTKSKIKHGIEMNEIESCFLDPHILPLGQQYDPPCTEERYGAIAKSVTGKIIFLCFTIRNGKIRPISARITNKKEREWYEQ